MPNKNPSTIDASMTAFLGTLSGANKSASTIDGSGKVMMVPLSTRRTTGKSQGLKCGMRQTCHPEALQRAAHEGARQTVIGAPEMTRSLAEARKHSAL